MLYWNRKTESCGGKQRGNGYNDNGPSGSGKTTLGKMVAEYLGVGFVDIDEISRLMEAVSDCEHFVMAGSMDVFHEYFAPFLHGLSIYMRMHSFV